MNDEVAAHILESGDHISASERNQRKRPSLGLRNIWSKFYTSMYSLLIRRCHACYLVILFLICNLLRGTWHCAPQVWWSRIGGGVELGCQPAICYQNTNPWVTAIRGKETPTTRGSQQFVAKIHQKLVGTNNSWSRMRRYYYSVPIN